MNLLENGRLMLGITYVLAGLCSLSMTIYLVTIKGNGLRSILLHLFGAWTSHYLVIGSLTLASLLGHEVVGQNGIRLYAAFFAFIQLTALYRLYLYIKWKP